METSTEPEAAPADAFARRSGPRRGIEARADPAERRTGSDRRNVPGWLVLFVDVFRHGERASEPAE